MTRVSLSDDGDYHLVNDEQDIRGRTVVDGTGQPLGTVASMLLDTDAALVTTLVLDDGTEIPVADVTLGDDVVYYSAGGAADGTPTDRARTAVFADGGRIARRERPADTASAHDADFRSHFESTYGTSGRSYDQMQPAYDYGRSAHSTYGDDFDSNESAMRSDYESRNVGSAWDDVKDAVRHGFQRARNAVT